ncbi:hypothetical protein [Anaerovorax sp. IOR16]|uniref:hypothetical protein n=1 Tax=Anaerovorax sp. IOR16 TaxID=2773458 RepID=UPI0019D2F325|nr:hypothetical protein [Anaerovorax sp. IOR16]
MTILDVAFAYGYNDNLKGIPQIPITNDIVLGMIESNYSVDILEAYFNGWKKGNDTKIGVCPRCGKEKMESRLHTNALSRVCDVYICDDCGTQEAIENHFTTLTPTKDWPIKSNNV